MRGRVFYKVIRKRGRCSAIVGNRDVRVRYVVGEWVKPLIQNSKLLVFGNRSAANEWAGNMMGSSYLPCGCELLVVPCYARNPRRMIPVKWSGNFSVSARVAEQLRKFWFVLSRNFDLAKREKIYRILSKQHVQVDLYRFPPATYACTAVKCIK